LNQAIQAYKEAILMKSMIKGIIGVLVLMAVMIGAAWALETT
jgi:hypothetical protein